MSRGAVLLLLVAVAMLAVASRASATAIREFRLPAGSDPLGLTPGPGGDVWFTNGGTTNAIGRITPAGTIKQFTQGFTSTAKPGDITPGADGDLWFTAEGSPPNAIGRVTPQGAIREFVAGVPGSGLDLGAAPSTITPGPGGRLWFLDDGNPRAIGRISKSGTITEFTMPDPINSQMEDLTAGPDGNMWFTDRGNTKAIGRITPNGTITEYTGMLDQLNSMPNGITAADGALWFTDEGSPGAIGSTLPTPTSNPTEFTTGLQTHAVPDAMITGLSGTVWFEDNYGNQRAVGRIKPPDMVKEFTSGLGAGLQDDLTLGIDHNVWIEQSMPGGIARVTPAGVITEFTHGLLPGAGSDGDQIVTGPDGNLWFSDRGAHAIGRVALQLPPSVRTGKLTSIGRTRATVLGYVETFGSTTKVRFQYGRTRAVGSTTPVTTLQASSDVSDVKARLSGLPSGTTIFYRVVATNPFGTRRGEIKQFKTAHA